MTDEDFNACKSYTYFVGQIGPSMETEYNAGLKMGQYFKEQYDLKDKTIGVYGGFIPVSQHVYRLAGLLMGLGDTYDGATTKDTLIQKIYASSGTIDETKITGDVKVLYLGGYDPSTSYTTLAQILAKNPTAFLSVGMTTTFFATNLNTANVPYSDIDAFTTSNGGYMNTGTLKYLAGKYASSIGPIFAAVMDALNGHAIRDAEGNAISLNQDFWVATSYAQFQKFQSADSVSNPIFNKTLLDTVINSTVTYAQFKTFVETDRTPA